MEELNKESLGGTYVVRALDEYSIERKGSHSSTFYWPGELGQRIEGGY